MSTIPPVTFGMGRREKTPVTGQSSVPGSVSATDVSANPLTPSRADVQRSSRDSSPNTLAPSTSEAPSRQHSPRRSFISDTIDKFLHHSRSGSDSTQVVTQPAAASSNTSLAQSSTAAATQMSRTSSQTANILNSTAPQAARDPNQASAASLYSLSLRDRGSKASIATNASATTTTSVASSINSVMAHQFTEDFRLDSASIAGDDLKIEERRKVNRYAKDKGIRYVKILLDLAKRKPHTSGSSTYATLPEMQKLPEFIDTVEKKHDLPFANHSLARFVGDKVVTPVQEAFAYEHPDYGDFPPEEPVKVTNGPKLRWN